jgi:hypothetical protein
MLVPACGSRCAREGASSEAEPARGGMIPRARRNPLEGGVDPRARRTSLEGGVSPRARRTLLEGAPCWAALVGRGGHHGLGCTMCVRFVLGSRCVCVLCFLHVLSRVPLRFFRGPSWLSPTGGASRVLGLKILRVQGKGGRTGHRSGLGRPAWAHLGPVRSPLRSHGSS